MTMTHIETIELASSQASITFSSIPQDYDDLVLKVSLRTQNSETYESVLLKPNNETANLSSITLRGNGSSAVSFFVTAIRTGRIVGANATSNTFGNGLVYISNYTKSQPKSISIDSVGENNATESYTQVGAGLWNDTTAINSLVFEPRVSAGFVSGSTISLYGVTAGGDGTVTTS